MAQGTALGMMRNNLTLAVVTWQLVASGHAKYSGLAASPKRTFKTLPSAQSAAWRDLTNFWQPPTSAEVRAGLIQLGCAMGGDHAFPNGHAGACVGVDGGCLRNATGDDGQHGHYRKPIAEIQKRRRCARGYGWRCHEPADDARRHQ